MAFRRLTPRLSGAPAEPRYRLRAHSFLTGFEAGDGIVTRLSFPLDHFSALPSPLTRTRPRHLPLSPSPVLFCDKHVGRQLQP